jgi:pyridoxine 5-phosphate synthase
VHACSGHARRNPSHAGWATQSSSDALAAAIRKLQAAGIRVGLFVDPTMRRSDGRAVYADRVEFYTEPFARAFARRHQANHSSGMRPSRTAHSIGLGNNAGHDLDLDNLTLFKQLHGRSPIGHAPVGHAL